MKKLLTIGIMLSGVSCFQAYASLEIQELKNGTGFEVYLMPLGQNSGMFYDLKNNHEMDAMRITLEQPDPTKRMIKMEAVDATDKETKEVDFTVYPGDKSWCPLGDLMLSAVNGLFLYRTYPGDSAVKFKTVTNGAALEVTFNATNPRQHMKYIEWCNKFGEAARLLLLELGVKLDFVRFNEAPPASQQAQKGADQAAVNTYVNKNYSVGLLREILTKLGSSYPVAARTANEERARAIDALKYGSSEFKAKSAAGNNDNALKAMETGYYVAKANALNLEKFKADYDYKSNADMIQAQLKDYLATPLGDGRYFVDVLRAYENVFQFQTPPQATPAVMPQQLTPEQKRQQQREAVQQRMQERATMRQQRQSQSVQGR